MIYSSIFIVRTVAASLLFCALVIAVQAQFCTNDACNSPRGLCYRYPDGKSFCSCRSGISGYTCASNFTAGCLYNTVVSNKTDFAPLSVQVYFTVEGGDSFNVIISSPLVNERNYTLVSMNPYTFENPNCSYPGPYWRREIRNCSDVFVAKYPWPDPFGCGWNAVATQGFKVFSNTMVMEHHDFSNTFENRTSATVVERITSHIIPVTISIPMSLELTSAIAVQAPVRVLYVVTKNYISSAADSATIEVATNLIWPYKLSGFSLSASNITLPSFSTTDISNSTLCSTNTQALCTQSYRITVLLGSSCTMDSDFSLNWDLGCQTVNGVTPPECAILPGQKASVNLGLGSQTYCVRVLSDPPIEGGLDTNAVSTSPGGGSDPTAPPGSTENPFVIGDPVVYHMVVNSSLFTPEETSLNFVSMVAYGEPDVILYSNSTITNDGLGAVFNILRNGTNYVDFSFYMNDNVVTPIIPGEQRSYTVIAVVQVLTSGKKREIIQRRVRTISFSSTVTVAEPAFVQPPPGVPYTPYTRTPNRMPPGSIGPPAAKPNGSSSVDVELLFIFMIVLTMLIRS